MWGCGPGQKTAYLRGLGLERVRIDLVPRGRWSRSRVKQKYPDLRFSVGSMLDLDYLTGNSAAVLRATRSSICLRPGTGRVSEFFRVLGLVVRAGPFHVGDIVRH